MRIAAILLVAGLAAGATGARAEEAGLECAMGTQKWAANTAICLPRDPRNWVVCNGEKRSGEDGTWRDTTISCDRPPPKSPAEWGEATEVPHPKPPAPDAKRVIDLFAGIEFTCFPAPEITWSADSCVKIGQAWAEAAKDAKIVGVVHDFAGNPDNEKQRAEAAGLPPGSAVLWTMRFKPTSSGGAEIATLMSGVLEMLPGIYGRRAILIGGEIEMRAEQAKPANALYGAKQVFPGNFQFLLGPR